MGERKRKQAELRKESNKSRYFASLNNCPTSPRKMRIVANLVRGMDVEKALHLLQMTPNEPAIKLRKLLLSAIANWQNKTENTKIQDAGLVVKTIFVNQGRSMKRLRTAPQGRGYRIQKRSNHVTLEIGNVNDNLTVKN